MVSGTVSRFGTGEESGLPRGIVSRGVHAFCPCGNHPGTTSGTGLARGRRGVPLGGVPGRVVAGLSAAAVGFVFALALSAVFEKLGCRGAGAADRGAVSPINVDRCRRAAAFVPSGLA